MVKTPGLAQNAATSFSIAATASGLRARMWSAARRASVASSRGLMSFAARRSALGGGRVALGEAGIGLQPQSVRVLRVHLECPVGQAARGGGIEFGQGEHALPDQRLHRAGIDLQRLVEGVRGIGAVVLLQEEMPRLHFGLPAIRIGLEGVPVDLVEDERELRGLVVPAGVLRPGQADEEQRFRVGDVLPGCAGVGVRLHEPAHLLVGRGDVSLVAKESDANPAGEEVRILLLDCGLRVLGGIVPLAQEEEQVGALGEQGGIVGV